MREEGIGGAGKCGCGCGQEPAKGDESEDRSSELLIMYNPFCTTWLTQKRPIQARASRQKRTSHMMRWYLICACSLVSPPFTFSLMGSLSGQCHDHDNDNNDRLNHQSVQIHGLLFWSLRRFNDEQNRGRRRSSCSPHPFRSPAILQQQTDQDGSSSLQAPAIAQRQTSHGRDADWFSVEPTHTHTMLVIYHATEPKARGKKGIFVRKIQSSHTDGLCLLQPGKRLEGLIQRICQSQDAFDQLTHALQLWG
jgi:hypothetical protein